MKDTQNIERDERGCCFYCRGFEWCSNKSCDCHKAPEKNEWEICPKCGGPADNGNDRSYPPNAYECTKCAAPKRKYDPLADIISKVRGTTCDNCDAPLYKGETYERDGKMFCSPKCATPTQTLDTEKRYHKANCEYFRNNEKCDCGHLLLDTEKGIEEWEDPKGKEADIYYALVNRFTDETKADIRDLRKIWNGVRDLLTSFEAKIRADEADMCNGHIEKALTAERTRLHAAIEKEKVGPTLCGKCNMNGPLCKNCYANRRANAALQRIQDLLSPNK